MESIMSDHPLVSIVQPHSKAAYQLKFRRGEEQLKKGTGTTNLEQARDLARALSLILVGALFENPPPGTPDIILKMLGITPRAEKARVLANKAFSAFIRKIVGDDDLEAASADGDLFKFKKAVEGIMR